MNVRKRVAVFFGGRSPEHDVSVVTALQALDALDQQDYIGIPVYITLDGSWWTGDYLRDQRNYIPDERAHRAAARVQLEIGANRDGIGRLQMGSRRGLFAKSSTLEFDVALLAFHGATGENGGMQGLFEVANVPFTGMRPLACNVLMDKIATKRILAGTGIPLLPYAELCRPASGLMPDSLALEKALEGLRFPLVVKPVHLGSSIGVARVAGMEELRAALPPIFRLDTHAMLEPFVENLVEYNIAVSGFGKQLATSAIEKPKRSEELLDFRSKYMSEGQKKLGTRNSGLLSLTREISPELPGHVETDLRKWSAACFEAVAGAGAPRIDFLANEETGEVWLNEVNPCPGSFGYFLWEAAPSALYFPDLLSRLISEAEALHRSAQLPEDPTPVEARLFARR